MANVGAVIGITLGALFGLFVLIFIIYVIRQIKIIEYKTVMLVERFGKYNRSLYSGFHFLWPFVEAPRLVVWRTASCDNGESSWSQYRLDRIDTRDDLMDFPRQSIITRDNVEIEIHPLLVYKVVDPIRVAYEVYDICNAVEKLVQTALRSIIGDMGLDDTLASREEINRGLLQKIANITLNWGIQIQKVELLELICTRTIQTAMHMQIRAERVRRAAVITADGYREQVKTRAEGNSQAAIALAKGEQQVNILTARGKAEAKLEIARAEAQAIIILSEALKAWSVDPTQYLIGLKYIDTLRTVASRATNRIVYFPFESKLIGACATFASDS